MSNDLKYVYPPIKMEEFYTKYPNGHTIFESYIEVVNEVNKGIDIINTAVNHFDTNLDQTVETAVETAVKEEVGDLTNRLNNLITTPVPVGEILAEEIIDARQGAGSLGINITEVKSQLAGKASQTALNTTNARIDTLIANAGDGTVPSELTDIRVGADADIYATAGDSVRGQVNKLNETINREKARVTRENLFDKSTITAGSIVGNEGVITPLAGFDASDFIYVGGLTNIKLSLTHIVRCFDINKNYVADLAVMNSMDADELVAIPGGVYYIRFSTFDWATPTAQVGVNVDRTQYISFGNYYADDLVKVNEVLVSKTSTNPEAYSVFSEAVIKNRDIPNTVITVEAGEYDIYSELIGVYGQSFFDSHTVNTTDGWGLEIGNNITIKGSPNAKLQFNYPGVNTSVLGNFALLMLRNSDVKIQGVTLMASNCKYVVHDDWYVKDGAFLHEYEDVVMIMDNTDNPLGNNFRCIGGGVGNDSHISIDGCIFEALGTSVEKHLVSYHNAADSSAQSRITIKNNYFKDTGSIRLGYFGTSTLLTDVLITNNSYHTDVDVVSEDGITTNNNFNVVKFGNEIRG